MLLYLVECYSCVLFSSRVRIRFSDWLISCYAHVFGRLYVVFVTICYLLALFFPIFWIFDPPTDTYMWTAGFVVSRSRA